MLHWFLSDTASQDAKNHTQDLLSSLLSSHTLLLGWTLRLSFRLLCFSFPLQDTLKRCNLLHWQASVRMEDFLEVAKLIRKGEKNGYTRCKYSKCATLACGRRCVGMLRNWSTMYLFQKVNSYKCHSGPCSILVVLTTRWDRKDSFVLSTVQEIVTCAISTEYHFWNSARCFCLVTWTVCAALEAGMRARTSGTSTQSAGQCIRRYLLLHASPTNWISLLYVFLSLISVLFWQWLLTPGQFF